MVWTVISGIIAFIIITQFWDWYQARKAKQDPSGPVVMTAADPIGIADLTAKLKAWLESLGMDVKTIAAEIDQIKAFSAIVLIEPHVLKVVGDDKQAEIVAAFAGIKTAIGINAAVPK